MALNNRKITVYANPVTSLSDHPSQAGMTAAQLKAAFDANATGEIKQSINGIIDDLKSVTDGASGADEIGATANRVGGAETIQGQLDEKEVDLVVLKGSETTRTANENTRISSENTRVSNENTRISSENTRLASEVTRVNAENARIANENLRQQTAEELESNYAPRLTTLESQNGVEVLNTTSQTLSGAINEHEQLINDLDAEVGNLSTLNTTEKTNLVGAVNELFTSGNDGKTLLETTLIAKNATVSKVGDIASFAEINDAINTFPSLPVKTWLYNEGEEFTPTTGGIVALTSYPLYTVEAITKNADNLYLTSTGTNHICGFSTNNAIDFTNYTKLKMEASQFTGGSSNCILSLRVFETKNSNIVKGNKDVNTAFVSNNIIELDISNINGSFYPYAVLFTLTGVTGNANIIKMWLE